MCCFFCLHIVCKLLSNVAWCWLVGVRCCSLCVVVFSLSFDACCLSGVVCCLLFLVCVY